MHEKYRLAVLVILAFGGTTVLAEPAFNPTRPGAESEHLGSFSAGQLDVGYKGMLQRSYTLSRDQGGLLLATLEAPDKDKSSDERQRSAVLMTSDDDDSDSQGEITKAGNEIDYSGIYFQLPMRDAASIEGQGPLRGRSMSGRIFTIGIVAGNGKTVTEAIYSWTTNTWTRRYPLSPTGNAFRAISKAAT